MINIDILYAISYTYIEKQFIFLYINNFDIYNLSETSRCYIYFVERILWLHKL